MSLSFVGETPFTTRRRDGKKGIQLQPLTLTTCAVTASQQASRAQYNDSDLFFLGGKSLRFVAVVPPTFLFASFSSDTKPQRLVPPGRIESIERIALRDELMTLSRAGQKQTLAVCMRIGEQAGGDWRKEKAPGHCSTD